jgi:hypothetical protein
MARLERIEVAGAQAAGFLRLKSRSYQTNSLRHGIRPRHQQTDQYIEHREFRLPRTRVPDIAPVRRSMCSVVSACTGIGLRILTFPLTGARGLCARPS